MAQDETVPEYQGVVETIHVAYVHLNAYVASHEHALPASSLEAYRALVSDLQRIRDGFESVAEEDHIDGYPND